MISRNTKTKSKAKKSYRRRNFYKKAISQAKKKTINNNIDKRIVKKSEMKIANYSQQNFALTAVDSVDFDTQIKFLNPSNATGSLYFISQNLGQGGRVGNKITTQKATLKGVVHINTTWSNQNWDMCPLYVVLYIFRCKQGILNINDVETICKNRFFQAGNGSTGFFGTLFDMVKTPNNDVITLLKKKVMKVGVSQVLSAQASGTPNTTNQNYGDSTVGISKMFSVDVTKYLSKQYIFNDTDNAPLNDATYFMFVPLRVDGNLIKTNGGLATGTVPAYVDFEICYKYTDT